MFLRPATGRAISLRTRALRRVRCVAAGLSRTRAKLVAFAGAARVPPGRNRTRTPFAGSALPGLDLSLRIAAGSAGRRSRGLFAVRAILACGRGESSRTFFAAGAARLGLGLSRRVATGPAGWRWRRLFAIRAALGSGAVSAGDRHGEKLIHGEFAVAIPVELPERGRGVGDLFGGNLAVAVCIERGDDGRNHGPEAWLATAGSALRGLAGAGFAIVAALGLEWARIRRVAGRSVFGTFELSAFARGRRGIRGLCRGEVRRDGECEREEECVAFHDAGVLPGCLRIGSVHTISTPGMLRVGFRGPGIL